MSDNIRVAVQWKNSTVFAGEHVECRITFTNVSQPARSYQSLSPNPHFRGSGSHRERWKETLPSRPKSISAGNVNRKPPLISKQPQPKGHVQKPTLSLGVSNKVGQLSLPAVDRFPPNELNPREHKHRRSVSIVSIGGDTIDTSTPNAHGISLKRPGHGHTRAASLQVLPRKHKIPSPTLGHDRAFTVSSPLFRPPTSFAGPGSNLFSNSRSTSPANSKSSHGHATDDRSFSASSVFKFPHALPRDVQAQSPIRKNSPYSSPDLNFGLLSPESSDLANEVEQHNPLTRILSASSVTGTPRSSGDFYSVSNNSTDTLASEYVAQQTPRGSHRRARSRQGPSLEPTRIPKPEVLMMGYGQVTGSFTLDGSLVNQSAFEDVKKKGIVGGQGGGGVVRTDSMKRDSGILGSLGWGNLGGSFGGLLGASELSSIKDAGSTNSPRSIPILCTPQSVLFVDLCLGPGEVKSYTYSHFLPTGIPPTYKGKAVKISYSLVVGTQRATRNAQRNQVQRVEIPFKVLTGVNGQGDILGHDLMSPHIILTDKATVSNVEKTRKSSRSADTAPAPDLLESSAEDFSSYVGKLTQGTGENSHMGLLSPTEDDSHPLSPKTEAPSTMRESVDLAIMRSNTVMSAKRAANRFEISRSGDRVAVIMLARPAYRLGESVSVAVDFQDADLSCYSVRLILETSEIITPTLALRSKASVQRVTRRIHASQFEPTICATRVLFHPLIPSSSTPDFVTSGVNLEWKLRFEFVTSRISDLEESDEGTGDLMEEIIRDDRGSVKAAVQGLPCETFDVTVPLRVYGATGHLDENHEAGEFPI